MTLPPPAAALMGFLKLASSLRSFSRQAIMTPSWRRLLLPSAGAVKMLAWPDGRVRATAAFHSHRSVPARAAEAPPVPQPGSLPSVGGMSSVQPLA